VNRADGKSMNKIIRVWAFMAAVALAGCAGAPATRAPIVDHSVSARGGEHPGAGVPHAQPETTGPETGQADEKDWRPQVYKVQPGDTLYGIAFNFGLDYHELAELNNIPNPAYIQAGQEIRLFPAAAVAGGGKREGAPSAPEIVSGPLATVVPYSEQAVAQVENAQAENAQAGHAGGETRKEGGVKPAQPEVVVKAGVAEGNVPVHWEMPTSGKVIAGYSEADNRKGVDIAGDLGQPIYASAPGKVIFCGSGLRGYGKLIIIKHDEVYLTAYAHNDKLLVKEGQMVSKGQMIAQMGSTDANRVALHFEIRKRGKPVDPAKYLVFPKS
jgi:lipoprotein NlpD